VGGQHRRRLELPGTERFYDLLQRVLGYDKAARRIEAALGDTRGRVVLDVGGGTGNLLAYLARGTRYVCIDNDFAKLERLRDKRLEAAAILGDATRLPLLDKEVDDALCVAVTHHLSNDALPALVSELARVTRGRVVVWDALREPSSIRGRLLWRIDRGSFPRTENDLRSFLEEGLDHVSSERLTIHHHYLLWVGRPRHDAAGPVD
jgi:ubiquinone/menaquinone biosynthesis C-methylase UbiE